jgi:hypothetical protein
MSPSFSTLIAAFICGVFPFRKQHQGTIIKNRIILHSFIPNPLLQLSTPMPKNRRTSPAEAQEETVYTDEKIAVYMLNLLKNNDNAGFVVDDVRTKLNVKTSGGSGNIMSVQVAKLMQLGATVVHVKGKRGERGRVYFDAVTAEKFNVSPPPESASPYSCGQRCKVNNRPIQHQQRVSKREKKPKIPYDPSDQEQERPAKRQKKQSNVQVVVPSKSKPKSTKSANKRKRTPSPEPETESDVDVENESDYELLPPKKKNEKTSPPEDTPVIVKEKNKKKKLKLRIVKPYTSPYAYDKSSTTDSTALFAPLHTFYYFILYRAFRGPVSIASVRGFLSKYLSQKRFYFATSFLREDALDTDGFKHARIRLHPDRTKDTETYLAMEKAFLFIEREYRVRSCDGKVEFDEGKLTKYKNIIFTYLSGKIDEEVCFHRIRETTSSMKDVF